MDPAVSDRRTSTRALLQEARRAELHTKNVCAEATTWRVLSGALANDLALLDQEFVACDRAISVRGPQEATLHEEVKGLLAEEQLLNAEMNQLQGTILSLKAALK